MATVRELVYSALTTDTALNTLGIDADHMYASGSLDGPQPAPFGVTRWGAVAKGIGPINRAPVTIYIHDDFGDYSTINAILVRIRQVMLALSASGQSANWIIDVVWDGDSGDLADDTYKTLMRYASFTVVANTL